MRNKIVLKRLSASDLTLFEHHFRLTPGTKQKAFNLDKDVFITDLYSGLPERMDINNRSRIPLDLSIFGPGIASLHNLQRKILKQDKNWRLDGELIYNPPENETRYNSLQKNDYAIIEFSGDFEPQAARIYLVAKDLPEDKILHKALEKAYSTAFSARKGMEHIDSDALAELIEEAGLLEGHPVLDFVDMPALEDAVQGGLEGIQSLRKRRRSRGVSQDEFDRAKRNAELTGRIGEELLNSKLKEFEEKGVIPGYCWESSINAVAPFDFSIIESGKNIRRIDAKSTSGAFKNPIHVSAAELLEMVDGNIPYDIYRLYSVEMNSAVLRISEDVRSFASEILLSLQTLPKGVRIDSISINPEFMDFGEEIHIDYSKQAEEGFEDPPEG